MKISVITVAYKNSKVVIDLLNSIAKYNDIGDELEVIIVDNSPEYARVEEVIKVAKYKNYIYIKADNKGFGAGNNRGAEIAKGDILAFLNPDIILIEPIFKKICQKFEEDGELVWLGGELLTIEGKHQDSYNYRAEYDKWFNCFLCRKWQKWFNVFDAEKMFLFGADIFIRKNVFEQVGCFDEDLFMFSEEEDLALRIQKQINLNNCIKYDFKIKLKHLGRQSTGNDIRYITEDIQSPVYYLKKHGFDYKKILRARIQIDKMKNCIDMFIRPYKVNQRKIKLKFLQENYPEIFE